MPDTNPFNAGEPEEKPSSPATSQTTGIAFILVTLFIDVLGIGIVIPILPELIKEFVGGSENTASWYVGVIGTAYALAQFVCAPIMGALSDRFGRRPILLAALFGLGIDFLIQGFAPNVTWLFVGRLIAGMMGASFTTAQAYIADISTPENRAQNFGLTGVMFGLGFIFGPALGGLLGGINLRLPFFVAAGLALINWVYGYFVLPESLAPENRSKFDLRRANPLGALDGLNRYPIVAGLTFAFFFQSLAQRGLENVWILFTMFKFDWNSTTNGYVLGLVGLTAAIVQGFLVKPIIKRIGERQTVIIGLTISSIAFAGYGLATQGWMISPIIVFGAFGGICGPALQSIVAGAVPSSEQGRIQGALTSLISLTNIIAPALFTTGIFNYFTSDRAPIVLPGAPLLVGAVLLFISMLIAARLFRRLPE